MVFTWTGKHPVSIKQLEINLEAHFQLFERVPFKAAWQRRDSRICLLWTGTCIVTLIGGMVSVPGVTLAHYILILLVMLPITLICALRMSEVYAMIRSERLGAGPLASFSDRLLLQQQWLCGQYECSPNELVDKARGLRKIWEERQEIRQLASNNTMGPRFAAFFRLPDTARFLGLVVGAAAIFATLITLGSSTDAIFQALDNWKRIGVNILVATFLCAELIMLWIMLSGMVREIGPSILEQLGLLPLNNRRIYRYLLAMHYAAEPITPFGRKFLALFKAISILFIPITALWKRE